MSKFLKTLGLGLLTAVVLFGAQLRLEAQPGPFSAQIQRALAALTSGTTKFTSLAVGTGVPTTAIPIFSQFSRDGQIQQQLYNSSDGTSAYTEYVVKAGTTNAQTSYFGAESALNSDTFGAGRAYIIFNSAATGQPGGDFYACGSASPSGCFFRWNTNGSTTTQTRMKLTAALLELQNNTAVGFAGGTGMAVANVGANSCGTTAASIAGGNNAFVITTGATSATQCRVAFTFAAATEWNCVANDDTTTVAVRTTPVDTTHTDFIGTFTAADKVTGICFPR